jgi:hypothetical protein
MALSDLQQAQLKKRLATFCEGRVPAAVRAKLRVGFRIKGSEAVLFRLYCQHRDLRWHAYEALPAARDFGRLLNEVDVDPTGIFWG